MRASEAHLQLYMTQAEGIGDDRHRTEGHGAHGNPDIGQRKGWGIINTVAGHRYNAALRLEAGNDLSLLVRQDFSHDLLNAELPVHCFGRIAMISRHHDYANAFVLELLQCLTSRGFDRICHAKYARSLLIDGD